MNQFWYILVCFCFVTSGFGSLGTIVEGPFIAFVMLNFGWSGAFYSMVILSFGASLAVSKAAIAEFRKQIKICSKHDLATRRWLNELIENWLICWVLGKMKSCLNFGYVFILWEHSDNFFKDIIWTCFWIQRNLPPLYTLSASGRFLYTTGVIIWRCF